MRTIFDKLYSLNRKVIKAGIDCPKERKVNEAAKLGFTNFKKVFDVRCYKQGSIRTKVSILRCFKRYLETKYKFRISASEMSRHQSSRD